MRRKKKFLVSARKKIFFCLRNFRGGVCDRNFWQKVKIFGEDVVLAGTSNWHFSVVFHVLLMKIVSFRWVEKNFFFQPVGRHFRTMKFSGVQKKWPKNGQKVDFSVERLDPTGTSNWHLGLKRHVLSANVRNFARHKKIFFFPACWPPLSYYEIFGGAKRMTKNWSKSRLQCRRVPPVGKIRNICKTCARHRRLNAARSLQ